MPNHHHNNNISKNLSPISTICSNNAPKSMHPSALPKLAISLTDLGRRDSVRLSQLDLTLPSNSEILLEGGNNNNNNNNVDQGASINSIDDNSNSRQKEMTTTTTALTTTTNFNYDNDDDYDDEEQGYVEFDLGGDKSGIVSSKVKTSSTAELIKYGKGNNNNNRTNSSLNVSHISDKERPHIDNKRQTSQSSFGYHAKGKAINSYYNNNNNNNNNSNNNINNNNNNNNSSDIILSEDDEFSDDDPDWKQMSTELDIDMYNEKGELITNNEIFLQDNKEQLEDGSKLGYTRIANEEQVAKFNKMNEGFDFLFNKDIDLNNLDKLHNNKKNVMSDEKIFFDINDHQNHTLDDLSNSKEDEVTTVSQLNSTKQMLKDSQKIAYAGLVKLIIVDMAINMSKLQVKKKSMKTVKKISTAHLSFQHWSMKMMDRIYEHMDLNDNERKMIENLSSHGLEPRDLIPSLVTVETLKNPLLNNPDNQYIKTEENDDLSDDYLKIDIKWTLVCDLFLNLIFDAVYDSRSRVLLLKFGEYLGIPNLEIYQFERRVTDLLEIEESSEQIWNEKEILEFRLKSNRKKQLIYIGLATIGGSLVIGLSAGLLAPVIGAGIAAGLTSIGIAGTSGFLAGVGGTTIVTTVGVLSGARIGRKGMLKRVGNVKTFEFRPIHNHRRVNLILTVSGWMNGNEDDVRLPFSTVDPVMGDIFSLLWEPEMLRTTGQTINILATEILTQSIQQILGNTILIAFMSSVQWPMLLSKLGYLLDNLWNVSLDRAWAAGIILADTLIQRNLGVRPITLVGFSLGARLIYSCLLELNKRGAFGLVEDVILFGSPLVFKADEISLCRSVVSGHFVNGYSKKDWVLGYLFRATSGGLGRVAGLAAIEGIEGIENFDCTEFVNGHMEYRKQIPKLLKELKWEVLNDEFVEIDEPENLERQRELISEFENVQEKLDKKKGSKSKGKNKLFRNWFKPKPKEWWEVYDEGRKEVEKKKLAEEELQLHQQENGEEEDDDQSLADGSLFDVDEIAKEVAKIEKQLQEADNGDDDDGTLVSSSQVDDQFQPRSFKTKSVESTPADGSPLKLTISASNNRQHNVEELGKRKTSNLLQKIVFDECGENLEEASSSNTSAKITDVRASKSILPVVFNSEREKDDSNNLDSPFNVKKGDSSTQDKEQKDVELKIIEKTSTSLPNDDRTEIRPIHYSYYDDDDEFMNTGKEIKMTFA